MRVRNRHPHPGRIGPQACFGDRTEKPEPAANTRARLRLRHRMGFRRSSTRSVGARHAVPYSVVGATKRANTRFAPTGRDCPGRDHSPCPCALASGTPDPPPLSRFRTRRVRLWPDGALRYLCNRWTLLLFSDVAQRPSAAGDKRDPTSRPRRVPRRLGGAYRLLIHVSDSYFSRARRRISRSSRARGGRGLPRAPKAWAMALRRSAGSRGRLRTKPRWVR